MVLCLILRPTEKEREEEADARVPLLSGGDHEDEEEVEGRERWRSEGVGRMSERKEERRMRLEDGRTGELRQERLEEIGNRRKTSRNVLASLVAP